MSDTLLPPRFAGTIERALRDFAETGKPGILGHPLERVVVTRDGREIPVEVKVGYVSTGNDISFLSAAAAQKRRQFE